MRTRVIGLYRAAAASPRLRVVRLLWETSPRLTLAVGLFVLADGFLPNLALVAIGHSVGRIPAAVEHGLGSSDGRALLLALGIGTGVYALSLLRAPIQDLLSAHCSAAMSTGLQRRLARAVCVPAGVEHLEDPEVLDRLSSASGELRTSRPSDAPMALAGIAGDRLGGFFACAVLATFEWWVGLLFFVGWTLLRPPLRRTLAELANRARRATPALRHAWYYLGFSYRPQFAKEMRVFGLADWIVGRYRERWLEGMAPQWAELRRFRRRVVMYGGLVAAMYVVGVGALALAAGRHELSLGTLAVMLPMLPMTMQVGGVSAADVALEQMLAAVPDLDGVVARLSVTEDRAGADAAGMPEDAVRFESVSYRYPTGDVPVFDGLDLELPAGRSLALVGVNGAGKTTLVTLLARLRDPTAGRVTVDGVDLRDLDARSWQRQVAVVNQEFTRYPLTLRENVALCELNAEPDLETLEWAAGKADALRLIRDLPAGWETVCSTGYAGGVDLSGGQWQRVALARALYAMAKGARVLVLDEPTAQLDVRAEAAFYERFLDLTAGATTVVISHRFSTVRRAERIAVIDGGRITELGDHDELLASGGTYAEMFTLQAARFAATDTKGVTHG